MNYKDDGATIKWCEVVDKWTFFEAGEIKIVVEAQNESYLTYIAVWWGERINGFLFEIIVSDECY